MDSCPRDGYNVRRPSFEIFSHENYLGSAPTGEDIQNSIIVNELRLYSVCVSSFRIVRIV